jgi:hypothetical protein
MTPKKKRKKGDMLGRGSLSVGPSGSRALTFYPRGAAPRPIGRGGFVEPVPANVDSTPNPFSNLELRKKYYIEN